MEKDNLRFVIKPLENDENGTKSKGRKEKCDHAVELVH
tara:strand:- start:111 stop:224 length:114 start_codon:yes stop_codon:yes gene_type:complete